MNHMNLIVSSNDYNNAVIIDIGKYKLSANPKGDNNFAIIFDKGIHKKIDVNEIIMIKAESNYSYIILENDEKIFTSRTIKHWTQTFNSASLLRIHKTFLINVDKIKEINRKLNTLLLSDNHIVNYSRGMKKYLIEICHK